MSQQHMNYEDVSGERSSSIYSDYDGFSQQDEHSAGFSRQGQKLSGLATESVPTSMQRLVLALVSLVLLVIMTFGMIGLGYALQLDDLGGVLFFILLLAFYAVVALINVIFNRKTRT